MNWYQWTFFILRLLISLPTLVVGWLYVLLFSWGIDAIRVDKDAVLLGRQRDWFHEKWGFSTTIARGMLLSKSVWQEADEPKNRVREHEDVHLRQFEDAALLGLVLGLIVSAVTGNWLWLLLWLFSPAFLLPNFVMAFLRHARLRPADRSWVDHWILQTMYRDSEHERSASGQTDGHPNSWLARRRNNR